MRIFVLLLPMMCLSACGVKGKPSPPETPVFIGKGQNAKSANLPEAMTPEMIDEYAKQNAKKKQTKKAD